MGSLIRRLFKDLRSYRKTSIYLIPLVTFVFVSTSLSTTVLSFDDFASDTPLLTSNVQVNETQTIILNPILTDTLPVVGSTPTLETPEKTLEMPTETPSPVPIETATLVASETMEISVCSAIPLDVVLIIDRSTSMRDSLDDIQQAAKNFVDLMQLQSDQVGIVSFSNSAHLDQELTQNELAIKQAIDNLSISSGTNIAAGIIEAQTELTSGHHNHLAKQVIILLSDGSPSQGMVDPQLVAQAAKEAGIYIITIGLGDQVNFDMMNSIASSLNDYYYAPDSSTLSSIYQIIAGIVRCDTLVRTLTPIITETYTPSSSNTPTIAYTPTVIPSSTITPTYTTTPTATWTPSQTPSNTPTPTATNNAPIANKQSITTLEDVPIRIILTGSDEESGTLAYTIVARPLHGTLTGIGPILKYAPEDNYSGYDFFTFKVNDGALDSATKVVDINVTAINDAPIARRDKYGITIGTPLNISVPGVLGNDFDVDGDKLSTMMVDGPTHGLLTLNMDGSFVYAPYALYIGEDSFTYKVTDGEIVSNIIAVSINVSSINALPSAKSQSVTTLEDTTKAITLTGEDEDNDKLSFQVTNQPAHGTLGGVAPNIVYSPVDNYNGSDTFTFKVNDGLSDSIEATVFITVTMINDAPVAVNDSVYTVNEDDSLNTLGDSILENDLDVDGDVLIAKLASNTAHGILAIETDGTFTYTPFPNYNGWDRFTYLVNDGNLDSSIATVNINVQPVPDTPICFASNFDLGETNGEITPSCTDADGNKLTVVILTQPTHGTIVAKGEKIYYTPNTGYHGLDSFIYRVNDGSVDSTIVSMAISNNLPREPILVEPIEGGALHQSVLPYLWQFVWDAPPAPCYSNITILGPARQSITVPIYDSVGQRYKYDYLQTTTIPKNKLTGWSWRVASVCPFGESISEVQNFTIDPLPFDWERWIQNASAVFGLISALLASFGFLIYVVSLYPFVVFFEKIALLLDTHKYNPITRLVAAIGYFDWLEIILRLIEEHEILNIKKKSEPAKQLATVLDDLDIISAEIKMAENKDDQEKVNALYKASSNLLDQVKDNNEKINEMVLGVQAKFDKKYYEKIKSWRQK